MHAAQALEIAEFGALVPSRRPETSKVEKLVRDAVREAGHRLPRGRQAVVCHHPDDSTRKLPLTPDILLPEHRIAIEVDPLGRSDHSLAYTHAGSQERDRLRNALLAEVGWTTIRLRLGGAEGDELGPRDVVVESSGFTRDARAALLDAVADAIANRGPEVRLVRKASTPRPARRLSHVVRIGPNRYTDDGHFFSWYPQLDGPKVTMRLAAGGRFLYTNHDMRFIAVVGLDTLPPDQWKPKLEAFLADKHPDALGTTKWPWGERFLVATDLEADVQDLVARVEYRAEIDATVVRTTANCERLEMWDEASFRTVDGSPLANLHPAALDLGYRVIDVGHRQGRSGRYQEITIARPPAIELET